MTAIPKDAKFWFKLNNYLIKGDGSFLDGLEGFEDDPEREPL